MKSHKDARSHRWTGRRTTDSLFPTCRRGSPASGSCSSEPSIETLVNEQVGEIKAQIVERNGSVIVEKTCPIVGTFTDTPWRSTPTS